MAASSYKVSTLRDTLLIFYETGKRLVTHTVESCAHIVGRSVGREDGDTLQPCAFVQTVDVVQTDIVVKFVWTGSGASPCGAKI